MDVTTQNADSSAATLELPAAGSAAYVEWRKSGNLPQPKTTESAPVKGSETSSATAAEEEHSGEAVESASASEAGTTQEQPRRGRSNAELRIKELLAENKRLKAQAGTTTEKRTESSTEQPEKKTQPAKLEAPKKPELKDFTVAKYGTAEKAYEAYDAAKDEYHDKNADYKAELAIARDRQQRYFEAEAQKLNTQLEEGAKRYGQEKIGEVLEPIAQEIMSDTKIPDGVKTILGDSPVLVDLLYVFAGDRAKFDALLKLARTNPAKAIREIVILEQLTAEELSGKAAKSETATETGKAETEVEAGEVEEFEEGEGEEGEEEEVLRDLKTGKFLKAAPAVPAKKITRAPGPTHEVNATGTAPSDEIQAALEAGNHTRYRELMNARDLKKQVGKLK